MDEEDGVFAGAAPDLGVEILYRVEAQAEAVFGALGQGVAVVGQVLGLAALVQGFESGASHELPEVTTKRQNPFSYLRGH